MKKLIALLIVLATLSCNNSKNKNSPNPESEEYIDIIGVFDRKELNKNPHADWFKKNYSDYTLDKETVEKLKPLFEEFLFFELLQLRVAKTISMAINFFINEQLKIYMSFLQVF